MPPFFIPILKQNALNSVARIFTDYGMNKHSSDNNEYSSDVVWHHATITRDRRESLTQHKSVILWFTQIHPRPRSGRTAAPTGLPHVRARWR